MSSRGSLPSDDGPIKTGKWLLTMVPFCMLEPWSCSASRPVGYSMATGIGPAVAVDRVGYPRVVGHGVDNVGDQAAGRSSAARPLAGPARAAPVDVDALRHRGELGHVGG